MQPEDLVYLHKDHRDDHALALTDLAEDIAESGMGLDIYHRGEALHPGVFKDVDTHTLTRYPSPGGQSVALEALSDLMHLLPIISVVEEGNIITVSGLNAKHLNRIIEKTRGTSRITNNVFIRVTWRTFSFYRFFALEVVLMLKEVLNSKNALLVSGIESIVKGLEENTWLKDVKVERTLNFDYGRLKRLNVNLLDAQMNFLKHYERDVPTLGLTGLLLDAAPGTGKTIAGYAWHLANGFDTTIFVVPLNSLNEVWLDTIKIRFKDQPTVWHSRMSEGPTGKEEFIICHYDYLAKLKPEIFKRAKLGIWLDESHNFNELTAARTLQFIDLCKRSNAQGVVWASGTPLKAMGKEVVPLFTTIDPLFVPAVSKQFIKAYGVTMGHGMDLIRHRIQRASYRVEKAQVVENVVEEYEHPVRFAGSDRFTLAEVSKDMRNYVDERAKHYRSIMPSIESRWKEILSGYEASIPNAKVKQLYNTYRIQCGEMHRRFNIFEHKDMVIAAKSFETQYILPSLDNATRKEFRQITSVYKYVVLTIRGEALGRILTRARIDCLIAMVEHADLDKIVESAVKKTLIFTSYVEVAKAIEEYFKKRGYSPIIVHGETNKNLAGMMSQVKTNPKANPVIATYDSLSTAVPVIECSTAVLYNTAFRSYIEKQAVARLDRLGQDSVVTVARVLLDTGEEDNISTRSKDLMEWSKDMVEMMLGVDGYSKIEGDVGLEAHHDIITGSTAESLDSMCYRGVPVSKVATESFLSSLKELFTARKSFKVDKRNGRRFIDPDDIVSLLHETVFNDKWMDGLNIKEGEFTNAGVIASLDYKSMMRSAGLVKTLKAGIEGTKKIDRAFKPLISAHVKGVNALFKETVNKVKAADDEELDDILDKATEKLRSVTLPPEKYGTQFKFGNATVMGKRTKEYYASEQWELVTTVADNSPKSIPLPTKEEIVELGKFILDIVKNDVGGLDWPCYPTSDEPEGFWERVDDCQHKDIFMEQFCLGDGGSLIEDDSTYLPFTGVMAIFSIISQAVNGKQAALEGFKETASNVAGKVREKAADVGAAAVVGLIKVLTMPFSDDATLGELGKDAHKGDIKRVLKETLLDSKRFAKLEVAEGKYTNANDLHALDYKSMLKSKGVVTTFKTGTRSLAKDMVGYRKAFVKHAAQVSAIHKDVIKSVVAGDKARNVALMRDAIKRFGELDNPAQHAGSIAIFGNGTVTGVKGQKGWGLSLNAAPASVKSIDLLSKEACTDLAVAIVEALDESIFETDFAKDYPEYNTHGQGPKMEQLANADNDTFYTYRAFVTGDYVEPAYMKLMSYHEDVVGPAVRLLKATLNGGKVGTESHSEESSGGIGSVVKGLYKALFSSNELAKLGKQDDLSGLLKKTVLNPAWMGDHELATGSFTEQKDLQALDYDNQLGSKGVVACVTAALRSHGAIVERQASGLNRYCEGAKGIHADLVKQGKRDSMSTSRESNIALMKSCIAKFQKLSLPSSGFATQKTIGNATLSKVASPNDVIDTQLKCIVEPTKVKSIPLLDKAGCVAVAELLVTLDTSKVFNEEFIFQWPSVQDDSDLWDNLERADSNLASHCEALFYDQTYQGEHHPIPAAAYTVMPALIRLLKASIKS